MGDAQSLSHVQLSVTPRNVACQAPLSMGLPRQESWGRVAVAPHGVKVPRKGKSYT